MKGPNLICISIDSLRTDYCSFINNQRKTTPNINRLSAKSTVYTKAVAPSTWTLQSHASVFTGLYPPEHQLTGGENVLGAHPTLAELLSDHGYVTESFGYNGWLEHSEILRGFEHNPTPQTQTGSRIRSAVSRLSFTHSSRDDQTLSTVTERIDNNAEPFFYFVHFNGTHHKYSPPSPYHKKFTTDPSLLLSLNLIQQKKIFDKRAEIYAGEYSPSDRAIRVMKDLYQGCIAKVDDLIQGMISRLKSKGILDNTIIVIFGDHGECFGEDGVFGHQFSVSDSLIRVPLLIHDPTGSLETGRKHQIVQLTDLYPTLLDLCGVSYPNTMGHNLRKGEMRESAFVYYTAPPPFLARIKNKIPSEDLPPSKQYRIWKDQSRSLTWYPDADRIDGQEELYKELKEHYHSLEKVPSRNREASIENIKENLRNMGYL